MSPEQGDPDEQVPLEALDEYVAAATGAATTGAADVVAATGSGLGDGVSTTAGAT